jgi:hypothetical protein
VGATSVAALAWRYRGVLRVTVVAKATFAFVNDGIMPRLAAQPVFRAEVHHGNSPMKSPRFSADLAPHLEHAEIFFTGHAYAPGARPREEMRVRLGVFDGMDPILDKSLVVRQKGGFTEMPLMYERAYGGIGWPDNPYGVGARPGSGEPTVLDPFDDKHLAGFGPIASACVARKKLLGSLPRRALDAPIIELPDSFDFGYFQAAPLDQRLPHLRGDEWIVLEGLHPTLPRARMQVPGARGIALVFGLSPWGVAEGQPLVLVPDTLRIDGDDKRVTLTFRGAFPVQADEALSRLRIAAGVESAGDPLVWPTREEMAARDIDVEITDSDLDSTLSLSDDDLRRMRQNALEGTMALGPDQQPSGPAMPFRAGPAPDWVARGSGPSPAQTGRRGTLVVSPAPDFERTRSTTMVVNAIPDFADALPFYHKPAPAPEPELIVEIETETEPLEPVVPLTMGPQAAPNPAPPAAAQAVPPPNAPAPAPVIAAPPPEPPPPPAPPPPPPPKAPEAAPLTMGPQAAPNPAPPAAAPPVASPKVKSRLYQKFGGDR